MRPLIRALSALLLLLAIALLSALITMRLAIHGTEVRVPSLTGLPLARAAQTLHSERLETAIDGRFYSTSQPAGSVLSQSPAPGTLVRKAWPVRVTVSLGPQRAAIPQIEGLDQNIAELALRRLGLQLGDVVSIPYGYAPAESVIAQTPLAAATGVESPKVSLLIARPQNTLPPTSVMPDLTGEPFTAAALTVVHAGFSLAPVQTAVAGASGPAGAGAAPAFPTAIAAPPGTVIDQSPAAGSRVQQGAIIRLTVQP